MTHPPSTLPARHRGRRWEPVHAAVVLTWAAAAGDRGEPTETEAVAWAESLDPTMDLRDAREALAAVRGQLSGPLRVADVNAQWRIIRERRRAEGAGQCPEHGIGLSASGLCGCCEANRKAGPPGTVAVRCREHETVTEGPCPRCEERRR